MRVRTGAPLGPVSTLVRAPFPFWHTGAPIHGEAAFGGRCFHLWRSRPCRLWCGGAHFHLRCQTAPAAVRGRSLPALFGPTPITRPRPAFHARRPHPRISPTYMYSPHVLLDAPRSLTKFVRLGMSESGTRDRHPSATPNRLRACTSIDYTLLRSVDDSDGHAVPAWTGQG